MLNFSNIWESGEMSDISFIIDGKEIKAHKLILANFSSIFKESFFGRLPAPSKIFIDNPNISFSSMKNFLGYFYLEKLEMDENNVFEILNLSNLYQVSKIGDECRKYLISKFPSSEIVDVANSVAFLKDSQLLDESVKFIIQKSMVFFYSSEFNKLSSEVLKAILKKDEGWMSCPLAISNCKSYYDYGYEKELGIFCSEIHDGLPEHVIIKRVYEWGRKKCIEFEKEQNSENVREILKEFIPLLRFPILNLGNFSSEIYPLELVDDTDAVQIMRTIVENSDNKRGPNFSRFSNIKRGFQYNR